MMRRRPLRPPAFREARARRVCSPVMPGQRATSPGTYASLRCRGTASFHGSRPNRRARPPSARMRPRRMRSVVVFPAPFGPRNPTTCPGSTVRSSPVKACVARGPAPKAFVSPSTSTTDSFIRPLLDASLHALRCVLRRSGPGDSRLPVRPSIAGDGGFQRPDRLGPERPASSTGPPSPPSTGDVPGQAYRSAEWTTYFRSRCARAVHALRAPCDSLPTGRLEGARRGRRGGGSDGPSIG